MPKRNRTDAPPRDRSIQAVFDRFTMKVFWIALVTTAMSVVSMGPAEALRRIDDSLIGIADFLGHLPGAY